ncbi:MAG: NADH-quinone oxidoreductase subunit NuoF [Elusimicrobia bacterium]|nr:NADH-quinone oxidoreductase subunit NuoF [Elusimicrobiota bacterium]
MTFQKIKLTAINEWEKITNPSKILIFVGMATCGKSAGADDVETALVTLCRKKKINFEIIPVGCIGLCYLEPLIDVSKPGGPRICFGNVTVENVPKIVDYILHNSIPKNLVIGTVGEKSIDGISNLLEIPFMKHQVRRILRRCGFINPENIYHYIAEGGYSGLEKALKMSPEGIINEIKKSGLRGRGGVGFPTGIKWELCRHSIAQPPNRPIAYIICNAEEGEPGTFKDRVLLESDPHSIIEGMVIAGYAIGAKVGYIYINNEYSLSIERIQKAIKDATELGFLGKNILGSNFCFQIFVVTIAGGYVSGEETALLELISGKRAIPRFRPPYPVEKGLSDKPTVINNVETYANVPQIILNGADWLNKYGTEKSKGTKLFSISGIVNNSGVVELPLGISLKKIIFNICGGLPKGKKLKAVFIGGPTGGCVPGKYLDKPVDFESLSEISASMGSGGIVIVDTKMDITQMCKYFVEFSSNESCGKCTPCRVGTKQLLNILEKITSGNAKKEDLEKLKELSQTIKLTSLCGLGQAAPNPVISTLKHFSNEYENKINH